MALPAAIAVIMFSLGLTLTRDDFKRVLVAPRGVAIGMLNLALISPLLSTTRRWRSRSAPPSPPR